MSLNFRTDHTEFFRWRMIRFRLLAARRRSHKSTHSGGDSAVIALFEKVDTNLIFFTLEEAEPEIFSLHGWDDRNEWDGGCCFAKTFPSNIQTLLLLPAGNPDSIFLPRGDTLLPCEISPSFLPLALGCGHANLPQLASKIFRTRLA